MTFEENNYINLTNCPKTFVYFLIDKKDVVYVGQTTIGLSRVYTHYKDKTFTEIYVIECESDELDELENKYIIKYKPKYNLKLNTKLTYTYGRVVKLFNERMTATNRFTKHKLCKLITYFGIVPINFKNEMYLSVNDVNKLLNIKEDDVNEIFNIRL